MDSEDELLPFDKEEVLKVLSGVMAADRVLVSRFLHQVLMCELKEILANESYQNMLLISKEEKK